MLRELAGGLTLATAPDTEAAARRLLAKPRTPPLTPAQAETLAIVAYLQPVSRPEITRIRGVSADSAAGDAARARADRGGRALAVRRRPLPHDAALPQALRPRRRSTTCPTPTSGTRRPRRRPSCATACCAPARRAPASTARAAAAIGRGSRDARYAGGDPASAFAASWPQAASMSRPRVRRTVARRRAPRARRGRRRSPRGSSRRSDPGRVVRDQVDLEDRRVEQLGERERLLVAVVDAGEHHVLDEDHAAACARRSARRRRARRRAGSGR